MRTSKTFSIHFWLNTAKQNNDLAPIYARITVDGKRVEISLKRQTSVTYWDTKAKKTTQKSDSGKALNQYLDQVYSKLLLCHKQLTSDFDLITASSIKNRFVGEDEQYKTLLDLIEYHDENMAVVLKKGTLKNYGATSKYLRKFLIKKKKIKDIYLKQMSYRFILDFELYLRKSPSLLKNNPLSNNGIMKHLERFKKLMNLALDLEWIDKNPFARYKLKFQKREKEFLSQFELDVIENSILKDAKLEIVKDIFVFSCYTGLAYIDVKNLTVDNIQRGVDGGFWIFTKREKSEQFVKIPILKKAQRIIDKYKETMELRNDRLLPVYSNQKVNVYLKLIAIELKIKKPFTFHSARHTFATTVTLSNGVPIETVSKLLGHSKLSTTQIYARVLEKKVSEDIMLLKHKLNCTGSTESIGSFVK